MTIDRDCQLFRDYSPNRELFRPRRTFPFRADDGPSAVFSHATVSSSRVTRTAGVTSTFRRSPGEREVLPVSKSERKHVTLLDPRNPW